MPAPRLAAQLRSNVSDDEASSTLVGYVLEDGSEFPPPEVETERLATGHDVPVGATLRRTVRVFKNDDSETEVAGILDRFEQGLPVYLYLTNRLETEGEAYGPVRFLAVHERPAGGTAQAASYLITWTVAADKAHELVTHYTPS